MSSGRKTLLTAPEFAQVAGVDGATARRWFRRWAHAQVVGIRPMRTRGDAPQFGVTRSFVARWRSCEIPSPQQLPDP